MHRKHKIQEIKTMGQDTLFLKNQGSWYQMMGGSSKIYDSSKLETPNGCGSLMVGGCWLANSGLWCGV